MREFLGAYCSAHRGKQNACDTWTLTDDTSKLANLPDEDVIFVSTLEGLQAVLDARHGVTGTGLRYTEPQPFNHLVNVYTQPCYDGTSLDELTRHLEAQSGGICCRYMRHYVAADKLRPTDIFFTGSVARLDRKAGATRRKRFANRQAKQPTAVREFMAFGGSMLHLLVGRLRLWDLRYRISNNDGQQGVAARLLAIVSLFNAVFGKNAHRKLDKFHALHAAWRAKAELNTALLGKTRFGVWMAREATKRLPAIRTTWEIPDIAADIPVEST